MKTSIKWGLMTLLVVGGGLLLGGNAIADSNQDYVTKTTVVSTSEEKVKLYEEQTKLLAEQIQDYLSGQRTVEVKYTKKTELTQAQLDMIEAQVKDVAKKTAVLKEEVEKFVAIRAISEKVAAIKIEVAKLILAQQAEEIKAAKAAEAVTQTETKTETKVVTTTQTGSEAEAGVAATQPEDTQGQGNVEAQIAMIKEQIKDLTAEYEVQKAAEEAQASEPENTQEIECEGGVCSANIDVNSSEETVTTKTATTKGFWQNVSDFLKNLFTF